MPKHSTSRSRSRDRKRDHKHKDKKKHKKRSRSSERRGRKEDSSRDRRGHDPRDEQRSRKEFRDGFDGRDFHQSSSYRNEEIKGNSSASNDPVKKSNRFSDIRKTRFSLTPIALDHQQQQANARSMMPPPTGIPGKRRKFIWTDADESELKDQCKITYELLCIVRRAPVDESQPALMLGTNSNLIQNLNPAILAALQDSSKIKKKIYLPKNTGVNYIGLLIGPRGLYQKRLEEESGCKILIRGKGSQKEGSAPQPDDEDDQHVLIIGDSIDSVRRAQNAIERVISADEQTRNKIREEQLSVAAQINNQAMPNANFDDSMMTPYGPPSPYAYIIPVPNDCVGLIIGKGGETIRQLQMESGAKIQVAKKEIPNSNLRNVFVEGSTDKYQRAKDMIEEIIREHRRNSDAMIHVGDVNPFSGQCQKLKVPDKFTGLIIGKNGETLRGIAQRSNTRIFIPQKNIDPTADDRIIEVEGDNQSVEIARQEILSLIQRFMSQSGGSFYDYSKNPYGSGIAVYNQTKNSNDPNIINGAVPDSLKPDSGSYATNLLNENPMIAYATMQLTGWSYDDQNKPLDPEGNGHPLTYPVTKSDHHYQGYDQQAYNQDGYDYSYQNQYQGYTGYEQQPYPGQYDQQQYDQYYAQGQYPQAQIQATNSSGTQGQNPEVQPSTDASSSHLQPTASSDPNQQYQDYWNQYYQYYGSYPTAEQQQAYYQQYYPGYVQPDSGAYPQQIQGQPGTEANSEDQQQQNQQPAQ